MDDSLKPTKVVKIFCPNCGELMVKIYPWSSYRVDLGKDGKPVDKHNCRKCIANYQKMIRTRKFIPDLERLGMVEKPF